MHWFEHDPARVAERELELARKAEQRRQGHEEHERQRFGKALSERGLRTLVRLAVLGVAILLLWTIVTWIRG